MNEAIIGLIGVLLGAIIGIANSWLSNYSVDKRWRKEKRIENLKSKKQELEEKYDKCIKELYSSLEKNGNFNAELFIEAIYTFPKDVRESISKNAKLSASEKNKDIKTLQNSIWEIIEEMKKSLIKIDKEIEAEINN